MKNLRQFTAILLVFIMTLSLVPANLVFAEDGEVSASVTEVLNEEDDLLSITGESDEDGQEPEPGDPDMDEEDSSEGDLSEQPALSEETLTEDGTTSEVLSTDGSGNDDDSSDDLDNSQLPEDTDLPSDGDSDSLIDDAEPVKENDEHPILFSVSGQTRGDVNSYDSIPFESFEVAPVTVIEGQSCVTEYEMVMVGNELQSIPWTKYSIAIGQCTFFMKDGTTMPIDILRDYEYSIDYIDDQSYQNQWTIGTHEETAIITITGTWNETFEEPAVIESSFIINIIEDPILTVTAEPVTIRESEYQWTSESYWDEDLQTYIDQNYKYYNIYPYITVTARDGEDVKTFSGPVNDVISELTSYYGTWFSYRIMQDQSYENQWHAGEHEATVMIEDTSSEPFTVTIAGTPISEITVEDFNIYAGANLSYLKSFEKDENGHWNETVTNWYSGHPMGVITVQTTDGRTIQGNLDDVINQLSDIYGYSFNYNYDAYGFVDDSSSGSATKQLTLNIDDVTTTYNVTVVDSPVTGITVDPLIRYVGSAYEDGADFELVDGETPTYMTFMKYDIMPYNISVATPDNTYTGTVDEVLSQLNADYGQNFGIVVLSDQAFDQEWSEGSHEATICIGPVSATYVVTVKPSPVTSIAAEDVSIPHSFYEETWESGIDDTGMEIGGYYHKYNPNPVVTVTANDDGEPIQFTGLLNEAVSELNNYFGSEFGYTVITDQSYTNQWEVGTHSATVVIGSVESDPFAVEITGSPITAITVNDYTVYEGTYSGYRESLTQDENGNWVRNFEPCHSIDPKGDIVVSLNDGNTVSGDIGVIQDTLRSIYGYEFYCDYNETSESASTWNGGDVHEVTLTIDDVSTTYHITVEDSPILSVDIGTMIRFEGNTRVYYDAFTQEWTQVPYNAYDLWPDESFPITVETTEGTITGSVDSIISDLTDMYEANFIIYVLSDQSPDQQWDIGTHEATLIIGNTYTAFDVAVEKNPIEYVTVGDMVRYKGISTTTDGEYDENGTWWEWQRFDINPSSELITVKLADIEEPVTGNGIDDVINQLKQLYGVTFEWKCESDQSFSNQWDIGEHSAIFTICSVETTYNVIVEDYPIQSVSIDPISIIEGSYSFTDFIDGTEYGVYDLVPNNILIQTVDDEISGNYDDIYSQLTAKYGPNLDIYFPYNNSEPWDIGEHVSVFRIGSHVFNYVIHIIDNPIKDVTIEPVTVYKGIDGSTYLSDSGDSIYYYYPEPDHISITVEVDGEQIVIEGNVSNIYTALNEQLPNITWSVNCTDDQDYENEWAPGDHTAQLVINNICYEYDVIVKESPIKSVSVEDLTYFKHCGNASGNAVEADTYVYSGERAMVTVEIETDEISDTYTGTLYKVGEYIREVLGRDIYARMVYREPQGTLDTEWDIGDHNVTVILGDKSADFTIHIVENLITSVTAEDLNMVQGETNLPFWDVIYDDYGNPSEVHWDGYDYGLVVIHVETSDGQSFIGPVRDVVNRLESYYQEDNCKFDYSFVHDQTYDNQWDIGSHQVLLRFGGQSVAYNVIIADQLIEDIIVNDVRILEGDKKESIEGYQEGDDGIWYPSGHKRVYNTTDVGQITLKLTDGSEVTGYAWELQNTMREQYGINSMFGFNDGGNSENWEIGEYDATISFGGFEKGYKVIIEPNPIASVEVSGSVSVLEGDTRRTQTWIRRGSPNNPEEPLWYEAYFASPDMLDSVKVCFKDGSEPIEGRFGEVVEALRQKLQRGITINTVTDQSPQNNWGIGAHTATLYVLGVPAEFTVNVVENPIISVEFDNVRILEGDTVTKRFYINEQGAYVSESFEGYADEPGNLTIVTNDNKSYSGNRFDVFTQLEEEYGVRIFCDWRSTQSPSNKWEVGEHTCVATIMSTEYPYTVEVVKNPISSITVDPITMAYSTKTEMSTWTVDENGQVVEVKYNGFVLTPNVTVECDDQQTTYEGNLFQVADQIIHDLNITWANGGYAEDDQAESEWGVGTHVATAVLFGFRQDFTVNITQATG